MRLISNANSEMLFVGICLNLDDVESVDGAARSGLGATRSRVL
ncbi:hypothetical protein A2U01_0112623, partial [Trifolium medium]|nr:hypothetical protein [Trifolium medium]